MHSPARRQQCQRSSSRSNAAEDVSGSRRSRLRYITGQSLRYSSRRQLSSLAGGLAAPSEAGNKHSCFWMAAQPNREAAASAQLGAAAMQRKRGSRWSRLPSVTVQPVVLQQQQTAAHMFWCSGSGSGFRSRQHFV